MATLAKVWTVMLAVTCAVTLAKCRSSKMIRDVTQALVCAHRATRHQLRIDAWRQANGIDVSVAKQSDITPSLMNGQDSDLSSLVNPAIFINNIRYCSKGKAKTRDIPTILRVGMRRLRHVIRRYAHCPYRLSRPCVSGERYRRADGSCNNLEHPLWGSAKIPLLRERPPVYEGKGKPRQHGQNKRKLPSTRLISTTIHTRTHDPPQGMVTSFYTGFGQFLAHDLSNTPISRGHGGVPINCCKNDTGYKCANIDIPRDDPYFAVHKRRCMAFTRSAEGTDCVKGTREQINLATSFIDGSTIYGDNDANFAKLVDKETGKMKKSMTDLLPVRMHQNEKAREMGFSLFSAGDPKINESPQLFSANLLFHRQHNYIATKLLRLNPAWNGERVFQEARRIVIGVLQHVVFNEYLPATLPREVMTRYKLWSQTSGYYTGYSPTTDPTVSNAFATAAMRFGHSMLNHDHAYADRNFSIDPFHRLALVDSFFKPLSFIEREMDINRGQIITKSEDCDRTFVGVMTNELFQTKPGNGMDITALNNQRGRDHGLAPYAKWRIKYNLVPPTNWTRASFPDHRPADIDLFKRVYNSPADIDLYTGSVSEIPVENGTVGPLMAEMIARQFARSKSGDRFWYETGSVPQRFTPEQLQEIRKLTIAHIMCDCLDVSRVQVNPFLIPHAENPTVECASLDRVDLSKWTA